MDSSKDICESIELLDVSETKCEQKTRDDSLRPLQLLHEDENGLLTLHVEQLEQILQKDELRGRHLVVISVVGAFRKGKSFLLSNMINYLRAQGSKGWLSKSLRNGFSWRSGSSRETTGVLFWPEIFPLGENLSVMLVDTQGMFDEKSSFEQNSFVFTFATMLSSVQIFNISQQIQMDDLRHLEVFVELGRLLMTESDVTPFQQLVFLVRDCPHKAEYSLGFDGGKRMLKEKWMQNSSNVEEKYRICQKLSKCFSNIKCGLMCHPGKKIAEGHDFESVLDAGPDDEFIACLDEIMTKLLNVENLPAKKFLEAIVTPDQFPNYVRQMFEKLQTNSEPRGLFECMIEISNQEIVHRSITVYENEMSNNCNEALKNITCVHENAVAAAMSVCESSRKFGGQSVEQDVKTLLNEGINKSFKNFEVLNIVKQKEKLSRELTRLKDEYKLRMSNKCTSFIENLDTFHENCLEQLIDELQTLKGFQEEQIQEAKKILQEELKNEFISYEKLNIQNKRQEDEEHARELYETNENHWRLSAVRQQQKLYELLGDRYYDCISYDDKNKVLERKVAFALYGPPTTCEGLGYDDENLKFVIEMCKFIKEHCNKFSGNINIYFSSIHIHYAKLDFSEAKIATLFRIGKPGMLNECIFIDTNKRMYRNWEQFIAKNKLPKCRMCYPENGVYQGDEKKLVKVKFEKSRACNLTKQFINGIRVTANVVGIASVGVVGIASALTVPVAGPLIIGALIAGGSSSLFVCGDSIATLVDRAQHGQSINLNNLEAISAWINIGITPAVMVTSIKVLAEAGLLAVIGKFGAAVDDFVKLADTVGSKTLFFLLELAKVLTDKSDRSLTLHAIERLRAFLLYYFHIFVGENSPLESLGQKLAEEIAANVRHLPQTAVAVVLFLVTCTSPDSILQNLESRSKGLHAILNE